MTTATSIKSLTQRPAWKVLAAHHKRVQRLHLRKLFAQDPKRGERMTAEAAGIFLDYSKKRITDQDGLSSVSVIRNALRPRKVKL